MQQLQFLQTVLLVLQILVCVGLVAVILLQRSEGGALGMGGGGGGMMTARGAGNLLTRTTAVLASMFFALSVGLVVLGNYENSRTAVGNAGGTLRRNPVAAATKGGTPATPPAGPLSNAAANANSAGSLGDLETGAPIQLKPAGQPTLSGTPATKQPTQPPAAKK
jgi:preprotein translocase subunit SecG